MSMAMPGLRQVHAVVFFLCLPWSLPAYSDAAKPVATESTPKQYRSLDAYGYKYAYRRQSGRHYQAIYYDEQTDASGGARQSLQESPGVRDPWERWNRGAQRFNDWSDTYLLRPAAVAYKTVVPSFVRRRSDDFIENLKTPVYFFHSILQGNIPYAGLHLFRFLVNTIFGLGGLFDVASHGDLPEAPTGFADTFRAWQIGEGNYLVLPGRPPGTTLENVGGLMDVWVNVLVYADLDHWQALAVIDTLNSRVDLLSVDHILRTGGDRYTLTRNLYYALKDAKPAGSGEEVSEEEIEAVFDDTY